jgi:hypothetical protein
MIDLKDLLDERSANPPSPTGMRSASVARRIVERRRRRAVGAVAAGFVAVALTLAGIAVPKLTSAPPPASPTPAMIGGFSEYTNGLRVLSAVSGPMTSATYTATWTPTSWDVRFLFRCDDPGDQVQIWVTVEINGLGSTRGICQDSPAIVTRDLNEQDRSHYGLELGKPATISIRADYATAARAADQPELRVPLPAGNVGVAVAIPVDFSEYVFPPRPAALKNLPDLPVSGDFERFQMIRSLPDPNAAVTTTLTWSELVEFHGFTQTPGRMRIEVNGVTIEETWWDYGVIGQRQLLGSAELTAQPRCPQARAVPTAFAVGERVTVTIRPEQMTGAWQLQLRPVTAFCENGYLMVIPTW